MALGFGECLSMKAECATFWAGWGVITTAAVGVITVLVALLAWLTSRRAALIARQATQIAEQQHKDAVETRLADARILGRLLVHEVSELPTNIFIMHRQLEMPRDWLNRGSIHEVWEGLDAALSDGVKSMLPGLERVEERIYKLPEELGDSLATLLGYNRTLNDMAYRLAEQIRVIPAGMANTEFRRFTGNPSEILDQQVYLVEMSKWAVSTANALRHFAGEAEGDYSRVALKDP